MADKPPVAPILNPNRTVHSTFDPTMYDSAIARTTALLPVAAMVLAGCGQPHPGVDAGDAGCGYALPPRAAVVIFGDGVSMPVLSALLAEGRLPNIAQRFVRGGATVENAVTCLPSVTYAIAPSIITGKFPSHHGVMGNRWFDRHSLVYQDYGTAATYRGADADFHASTIYEILNDHLSFNVQNHTRRGASYTKESQVRAAVNLFLGGFRATDRIVGAGVRHVREAAQRERRWPSLMMFYMPGVDQTGHDAGPDSDNYRESLINFDAQIGRICDELDAAGLAGRTLFVVTSDHGLDPTPAGASFDLTNWLAQNRPQRFHVGLTPPSRAARVDLLQNRDGVLVIGADRRAAFYLRGGGEDWNSPPTADAIEQFIHGPPSLIDPPCVQCAAWPLDADRVRVESRHGSATIERMGRGADRQYRVSRMTGDPLAIRDDADLLAFVEAGWHDRAAWLMRTADAAMPDFVVQVGDLFDSHRAGDAMIFAVDHASFDDHYAGGHGSCLRADMHIPMYIAGPDIAPGTTLHAARVVDVAPTIVEWLGGRARLDSVSGLDGRSLLTDLTAATPDRDHARPSPHHATDQRNQESD
jgi:hypothetical protein